MPKPARRWMTRLRWFDLSLLTFAVVAGLVLQLLGIVSWLAVGLGIFAAGLVRVFMPVSAEEWLTGEPSRRRR